MQRLEICYVGSLLDTFYDSKIYFFYDSKIIFCILLAQGVLLVGQGGWHKSSIIYAET